MVTEFKFLNSNSASLGLVVCMHCLLEVTACPFAMLKLLDFLRNKRRSHIPLLKPDDTGIHWDTLQAT